MFNATLATMLEVCFIAFLAVCFFHMLSFLCTFITTLLDYGNPWTYTNRLAIHCRREGEGERRRGKGGGTEGKYVLLLPWNFGISLHIFLSLLVFCVMVQLFYTNWLWESMHIYTLFTLMKVAAVQTPIYLATKDSTNVYKSTCKHFDDCFVWYHHCICYKGCVIPCSCSAQNINGRLSVWANCCHIEHSCYTVHYICLTLVTMHPLAGWLAGWLVFLLAADSFELLACSLAFEKMAPEDNFLRKCQQFCSCFSR